MTTEAQSATPGTGVSSVFATRVCAQRRAWTRVVARRARPQAEGGRAVVSWRRRWIWPLALALTVASIQGRVLGQGWFWFANRDLTATPPIDAKVFMPDGVTPLAGAAYLAQAYVKLAAGPDSSYAPVGTAVSFRTGTAAGYISATLVTTAFAPGTQFAVQMRAWQAAKGSSYEAALVSGGLVGASSPLFLDGHRSPEPPAEMVGLAELLS